MGGGHSDTVSEYPASVKQPLEEILERVERPVDLILIGPKGNEKSALLERLNFGPTQFLFSNGQTIECQRRKSMSILAWDTSEDSKLKVGNNCIAVVVLING